MRTFDKPLTQTEEAYYLRRMKEGDREARTILIERNMRLVSHIIKKYFINNKEMDDLISIGTIGLIKAITTFDVDKGNRLASYAAKCIENEILMMLRSDKKHAREVSLYEPIGTDKEGNVINLMDVIECEDEDCVEKEFKRSQCKWVLKAMREKLDKREYSILCMRYGIGREKTLTQREVAATLGISRSYVSRIEKKALDRLHKEYQLLEQKHKAT